MPELGTYGSVGGSGGQPPGSTWQYGAKITIILLFAASIPWKRDTASRHTLNSGSL